MKLEQLCFFLFFSLGLAFCGPIADLDEKKFKSELYGSINDCMSIYLGTGIHQSAAATRIFHEVAKTFLGRFEGAQDIRKEQFEESLKTITHFYVLEAVQKYALADEALSIELLKNVGRFVHAALNALNSSFKSVEYSVRNLPAFQDFLINECPSIFTVSSDDLIRALEEDSTGAINCIELFPSVLRNLCESGQIDFVGSYNEVLDRLIKVFDQHLALPIIDSVNSGDSYQVVNYRVKEIRDAFSLACQLALSKYHNNPSQALEVIANNVRASEININVQPTQAASEKFYSDVLSEYELSLIHKKIAPQESKVEHENKLFLSSGNRAKTYVSCPNFNPKDASMMASAFYWRCYDLLYSGEMFDNFFPITLSLIPNDSELAHNCIANLVKDIDNHFLLNRDSAIIDGNASIQKFLRNLVKTSLLQSFDILPIKESLYTCLIECLKSEMVVKSDSNQIYDLWNLPFPDIDDEEVIVGNKSQPEPETNTTVAANSSLKDETFAHDQDSGPEYNERTANIKAGVKRFLEQNFSDVNESIRNQTCEVFYSAVAKTGESPKKKAK